MVLQKADRLEMRVDQAFLDAVDAWRREQRVIPPRAEAIRRLVELGLRQQPVKKPQGRKTGRGA